MFTPQNRLDRFLTVLKGYVLVKNRMFVIKFTNQLGIISTRNDIHFFSFFSITPHLKTVNNIEMSKEYWFASTDINQQKTNPKPPPSELNAINK